MFDTCMLGKVKKKKMEKVQKKKKRIIRQAFYTGFGFRKEKYLQKKLNEK